MFVIISKQLIVYNNHDGLAGIEPFLIVHVKY